MQPLLTKGFENEPIDWELISQSTSSGKTTSIYEAKSKVYNKVYHLEDVSGYGIDVKQHLSYR